MWYDFVLLKAVAGPKSIVVMVHLTGPPNGRTVMINKNCVTTGCVLLVFSNFFNALGCTEANSKSKPPWCRDCNPHALRNSPRVSLRLPEITWVGDFSSSY